MKSKKRELAEQLKPDVSKIKDGDKIWIEVEANQFEKYSPNQEKYIIAHFPQPQKEEWCKCAIPKPAAEDGGKDICGNCGRFIINPPEKGIEPLEFSFESQIGRKEIVDKINEIIEVLNGKIIRRNRLSY